MGWNIAIGDRRGGAGGQGVTPFIEIPTSRTNELEEEGQSTAGNATITTPTTPSANPT